MRLESLDRGLQIVAVDGVAVRGRRRQLARDEEPLPDEGDARVGCSGLDRWTGRDGRPSSRFDHRPHPRQRLFQADVDEVCRLLRLDAGVESRCARQLVERDVERRRSGAWVDVPALVERRGPHAPVAHVVDEGGRGVGDEHLEIGRDVARRRLVIRVERSRDGRQMVIGWRQAILVDAADGDDHLLGTGRQPPRGRERARLEEARDGLRLQQARATHTHRRLQAGLFDPQPDGVLDAQRLPSVRGRRDGETDESKKARDRASGMSIHR